MKQYRKMTIEKREKQFKTEENPTIHYGKTVKKNVGRMLIKVQCESMGIKEIEGYDTG